jgi:hypothetical protein
VAGNVCWKRDMLRKREGLKEIKERNRGRRIRIINMDIEVSSDDDFRR